MIRVYKESRARHGLPADNENIDDAIHTDQRFRLPCVKLAEAHGQAHVYLFTWESPARRGALGACHALEMPFVFGTHTHPMEERFAGTGPEADRLSRLMMAAWIAFARTGDPNHEALGGWAVYDRQRRATMVFGRESGVQDAPFEEERSVWDETGA
jgi:para-nitrobenzyl esterase